MRPDAYRRGQALVSVAIGALVALACSATKGTEVEPSGAGGTGGDVAPSGGGPGTGGEATGGAAPSGGRPSTGGASGGAAPSSGAPSSGGDPGTGGEDAAGGNEASSGAPGSGGDPGTGGDPTDAGAPASGGRPTWGGSSGDGGDSGTAGEAPSGGAPPTGGSGGQSGSSGDRCANPDLVWRSGSRTNFTSYPDPDSPECTEYNGCEYMGQFAACRGTKEESWVAVHNIVAVFPDFRTLELHDLCLRSGSSTIVVTVLDTCADSDCDGCCTRNQGDADQLIDIESYTNERWGVREREIEWADLGPTTGSGCD